MSRIKDMTKGNPMKLILGFALPLMFGNIFQQLYSMVDTIVVGRVVGVEALASVGAASWLDWLVLGIVIGMTQGFGILMSQRFGAEDMEGLRHSVTMSVLLSIAMAVIFTTVSLIIIRPILGLLNTPENTIDGAERYIRIIFSGITIIVTYNLLAGILRALGDSRTPLAAMILASIVNIVLDILFVAGFRMGIAGVAVATLIAQVCACVYCFLGIRKVQFLHFTREDWRWNGHIAGQLLKLGTPVAFQNGIIAVGGLVVQYIVNGFGFVFVAGVTAAHKLCGLMEMAGTSVGSAVATFAGQNLGAGQFSRIRKGIRASVKISAGISLSIAVLIILTGKWVVRLFITGEVDVVEAVVDAAYPYLVVMSVFLILLYMLFIFRSALQGMGDTVIPMVSGIAELIMRISMVLVLPGILAWLGMQREYGIYFAEVSAWFSAAVLLAVAYFLRMRRVGQDIGRK